MSTRENVVFRARTTGRPAITYRSVPSHCAGVADSLAQARTRYRTELTHLLDVERHQLPPVVEHVEANVAGIWVRSKVGAVHRDRLTDRMFLQRVLAAGEVQDEVRAYLDSAAECGAEPVVVLAEPEDPLATVLDQMTPDAALVVTYPDEDAGLGWAAIHGPGAPGPDQLPVARVDRALSIESCAFKAVRIEQWELPRAG